MLHPAQARGFAPGWVLFDSWYASLEALKTVRQWHWRWLTRLKSNRRVNPDELGNVPLNTLVRWTWEQRIIGG